MPKTEKIQKIKINSLRSSSIFKLRFLAGPSSGGGGGGGGAAAAAPGRLNKPQQNNMCIFVHK